MSGTYPLTHRPGRVALRTWSPTLASMSHSQKRQARKRGSHRWYLKLVYGPMSKDEWNPIVGFIDEQAGQYEKFSVVIPGKETPRGLVSGATQVNGAHAAGLQQVALKNLPLSINGVFKTGDLVTFASHLKVYEITRDANSDGAGLATVYLNCPLFTALINNEALTWQNVSMKVAAIADTFEREWKAGLVCPGFDVEMLEDPY